MAILRNLKPPKDIMIRSGHHKTLGYDNHRSAMSDRTTTFCRKVIETSTEVLRGDFYSGRYCNGT